jgi:hypothetical protein
MPAFPFLYGIDITFRKCYSTNMAHCRVAEHQTQANPKTITSPSCLPPIIEAARLRPLAASTSALAGSKRGNGKPTDTARLYKGSGQPGQNIDHSLAACLTRNSIAYKDLIAKSGTSTLSPTIQQDFTGGRQLTLTREILKTRLLPKPQPASTKAELPAHPGQVSFDGGQYPMSTCGAYVVLSECEAGHHFGKRLLCGREWCEVCGQDKSAVHKRRQARLLPKLQQCHEVGYFVIEFPDSYRHIGEAGISPDMAEDEGRGWCYSKRDLRQTTSDIITVLAGRRSAGGRAGKRVQGYFARGVSRWHYFGDKKPGKWNPHLNVLVDSGSLYARVRDELQPEIEAYQATLAAGTTTKKTRHELIGIDMYLRGKSGYLPAPLLERIKGELRKALNCPDLIVNYSKRDTPGKMVHAVRYITRATFKDYTWNEYMAHELYDFRNARWWGKWQDEAAWQLGQAEAEGEDVAGLQAVEKLQAGICPDCGRPLKVWHHSHKGEPVRWSEPVDSTYLLIWSAVEIAGTGYYRIPWRVRSGSVLSPGEILRLQELRARHKFDAVHRLGRCSEAELCELRGKANTLKLAKRMRARQLNAAVWFGFDSEAEDEAEEAALDSYGDGLPIRPEGEAGRVVE